VGYCADTHASAPREAQVSKKTAFYERLDARTDEWMDLFGYYAPAVVTDTAAEYRAVRERAGLMDFSMLRKVYLDGPGAVEVTNRVVARDVTRLAPGRIGYGALTDEHGGMVDDCTVMVRGDACVRFCGANDRDAELFRRAAADTEVVVRERTDEVAHLCLQGPASRDMLQPLADGDLSGLAFPYYTFREDIAIGGIPVLMTRLGYTAELGYELWVERPDAVALWDVLVEQLEPLGMRVIGMTALDLFRIEGGFIIGGVEYDPTVSPYECGLGWSIDLAKPGLVAADSLKRDAETRPMRLASVVLERGGASASGAALMIGEREVGFVTQAVDSPYLDGATLGLAKLRLEHSQPGTRISARLGDAAVPGEVVRHPVYEPDRKRARES
jgi:aminomethyltransferase